MDRSRVLAHAQHQVRVVKIHARWVSFLRCGFHGSFLVRVLGKVRSDNRHGKLDDLRTALSSFIRYIQSIKECLNMHFVFPCYHRLDIKLTDPLNVV